MCDGLRNFKLAPKSMTLLFSIPEYLVDGWIYSPGAKYNMEMRLLAWGEFGFLHSIAHALKGIICKLGNSI